MASHFQKISWNSENKKRRKNSLIDGATISAKKIIAQIQ